MNLSTQNGFEQNGFSSSADAADAERTLRLIATLPAPDGLEERVKAGLHAAPSRGIVVVWPFSADGRGWMTGAGVRAAAAAIVLVVAGGSWEVYSHIRVASAPTAVVLPQIPAHAGGFSAAGATRKPQTLEGPVVAVPVAATQEPIATSAVPVASKHAPARQPATARHGAAAKPVTTGKAAAASKHVHALSKTKSKPVAAAQ